MYLWLLCYMLQLERLDFAEGPSLDSTSRKMVLGDLRCAYFFVSYKLLSVFCFFSLLCFACSYRNNSYISVMTHRNELLQCLPRAGSVVVRMDPLHFLARGRKSD